MKSKRFLSLILSLTIIFGALPSAYAEAASVKINMTAQGAGAFLCAPQFDVTVSADEAENYGFTDSVTEGSVSVLDALVKLHEIKYGNSFTRENAGNYLAVSISEYGASVTKLFETETANNGFTYNGGYPNDGTESLWGGYNGTTVVTQEIVNGDTVEFFLYQDTTGWSDELMWFNRKGAAVTEITAKPGAEETLYLKSYAYMYGYACKDADAIHALGSAVGGAQLAYVNVSDGSLTPIDGAVTAADGKVLITIPQNEGTYYLTAYIPEGTTGEPLVMSLTKIAVDKNAPESNPCDLATLSVASFDSNPDSLPLTPSFSKDTTEYSVPTVEFPSMDIGVYRSVYVKAAAEESEAKITAECNGISAEITDASNWKILSGALLGGKNNILKITVQNGTKQKVYQVKIPMKPKTNTPPSATGSDSAVVTVGDSYSLDLSKIFTDPDEIDTITYKVAVNGADAEDAAKDYTFTPSAKGIYSLVFTANDGTADSNPYTVTLTAAESVGGNDATILTAQTGSGGSEFSQDNYEYNILIENGADTPVLKYTAQAGCIVKVGDEVQTPDEDGNYTITLDKNAKKITVMSADLSSANIYTFRYSEKLPLDVPDSVTDYLCIGSQYTNNTEYGANPEETLCGKVKSLGNFGGYITYYYKDPITDSPKNKYGTDFYVIGNSFGGSGSAEPGQVYVSEDGSNWYALAGS